MGLRPDSTRRSAQGTMSTPQRGIPMAERDDKYGNAPAKISEVFRRRLDSADEKTPLRAVVLLAMTPSQGTGRRQDRRAAVQAVHESARSAMQQLASLMAHGGGRWLADEPDALGSIAIEALPKTLLSLASSEHVRGILEDQPVSLPRPGCVRRVSPAVPRRSRSGTE
jgi:hypothetical protein